MTKDHLITRSRAHWYVAEIEPEMRSQPDHAWGLFLDAGGVMGCLAVFATKVQGEEALARLDTDERRRLVRYFRAQTTGRDA